MSGLRPALPSTSTWRIAVQPETAFARIPDGALAGVDPPLLHPDYVSTRLRAPKEALVVLPASLSELTGPIYGNGPLSETDADLTRQHAAEPLGQRIVVTGRVLASDGKPPERVASAAHPLLAVRPRVPGAARDADVLPRRPAVPVRSDLQLDPRRARPATARLGVRPGAHEAGLGARVPLRHRPGRPRTDTARG